MGVTRTHTDLVRLQRYPVMPVINTQNGELSFPFPTLAHRSSRKVCTRKWRIHFPAHSATVHRKRELLCFPQIPAVVQVAMKSRRRTGGNSAVRIILRRIVPFAMFRSPGTPGYLITIVQPLRWRVRTGMSAVRNATKSRRRQMARWYDLSAALQRIA